MLKKTSIVGNIQKTSIVGNLQQTSLSKVVTVEKSSAVNVGIILNLNLKNCLVEKINSIQYDALAHIFFRFVVHIIAFRILKIIKDSACFKKLTFVPVYSIKTRKSGLMSLSRYHH